MFTLKFMRGNDCTVACGMSYDVHHRLSADQDHAIGATISVYPGLTHVGGVDFHVGEESRPGMPANPNSQVCFIENMAGKTIDKIGPFPRA